MPADGARSGEVMLEDLGALFEAVAVHVRKEVRGLY